jgi:serine/threonine protein kinase
MLDERIAELLLRWEAARRKGTPLSAGELCADAPHLAGEVRRRVEAIERMERILGVEAAEADTPTRVAAKGHVEWRLPRVPGYEIRRVLGQGGMGVVYEAGQSALRRTVAVKMMTSARLDPRQLARFRREAEVAARLQHPNVVQIFEVGEVEGQPFFSMEYVAGGSLADLLSRESLPVRQAAEIVEILARTLQAAHDAGIIHRDLKPSNVLLTGEGIPKIADFGIAKCLDQGTRHTNTGDVLGTLNYMSPEQAEGHPEKVGTASDVYGLGAILYELLAGRPPFQGSTPLETLRLVTREDPPAIGASQPQVPAELEAICRRCLEKSPTSRYPSAQALADDLRRFLDGQPVTAQRLGLLRRSGKWCRRNPRWLVTLGVLLLLPLIPIVFSEISQTRAQRQMRQRAERLAPQVREILQRNCFECHGHDLDDVRKDLNILDHDRLLRSDRNIVVPGSPDHSRLIQRIADGSMPPEEEERRLPRVTEEELTILKDWILGGAPPLPPEDPSRPIPATVPYSALAAQVRDIFEHRCYRCHKYDVAKGGIKILHHRLLLTVRKVVIPGQPDESELVHRIITSDVDLVMPPPPAKPLTPTEIDTVRQWIREGAAPFPKKE